MRRSIVVAGVLLALAALLVGGPALLSGPTTSDVAPERDSDPELVRPTDGESGFWPYLNSRRAFEKRSPINVVVVGEPDEVLRVLADRRDGGWEPTEGDQAEADPGTHAVVAPESGENASAGERPGAGGNASAGGHPGAGENATGENATGENASDGERPGIGATAIAWSRTTGGTRYAYVDPGGGEEGRWIEETAQVHDGTYFGHRYHVRLYESPNPDEQWVAMQAHSEHFDWFTLRHRVHGSHAAQVRIEDDLMDAPGVDVRRDVSRVYIGNENSKDADGWATFVDLAGVVLAGLAVGLATGRGPFDRIAGGIDGRLTRADRRRIAAIADRFDPRHLLLAVTVVALVVGVRLAGIALERSGLLSMHGVAAVLYPFLGFGLPVGTYLIARGLERRLDAAVVAGGALSVGIWLDYGVMGVTHLPVDVVVQRMLLVVTLGLIAAGAARRATRESRLNGMVVAGATMWVLLLAGTLFGYL